jgi:hypothetical protein
MGRPELAPGILAARLLRGYLSLRDFLGVPASKLIPDHTTISRTRG